MKYILVGGTPFTDVMTSKSICTGLQVIASSDDPEEMKRLFQYNWYICGGLLLVIDTTIGEAVELC